MTGSDIRQTALPRRAMALGLLYLVLALILAYRFYWLDPAWWKVAGGYDGFREAGPHAQWIDYNLHRGDVPWWNPLLLCGTPMAGIPQIGLFYPPNLIRGLLNVHATPLGAYATILGMAFFHVLLLGMGTFVLARRHRLGFLPCLTAAFVAALTSVMARRVPEHPNILAITAWLPWVMLLVNAGFTSTDLRKRVACAAGAGLVFGVSFLAGFMLTA